jgi:hypothetical protein
MKVTTRTVVLLGRKPTIAWNGIRGSLREGDELVILSLGYPVTAAQRAALLAAQDLAAATGAWFDAQLVLSTAEMLTSVRPDESVQVAARGWEARRLRSALAAARA